MTDELLRILNVRKDVLLIPLAKALFQLEHDPTIKDQAWFDFQSKAQRIISIMRDECSKPIRVKRTD